MSSKIGNPHNQSIITALQSKLSHATSQYARTSYTKAIKNIRRHTSPIRNEHQAQKIEGIGSKMGQLIKQHLLVRNRYHYDGVSDKTKKPNKNIPKKKKTSRRTASVKNGQEIPMVGAGGYALLLHMCELFKKHNINGCTKNNTVWVIIQTTKTPSKKNPQKQKQASVHIYDIVLTINPFVKV
eukprot:340250_1